MNKLIRVSALLTVFFVGGCTQFTSTPVATAQVYDPVDSAQQYVQRSEKITLSAGNAQEVNTRIQEIDPWPRYVGNTRIAVDGGKMADAVYRYRCGKDAQPPLPTQSTTNNQLTTQGSGSGPAGTGSTARPSSDCSGVQAPASGPAGGGTTSLITTGPAGGGGY
jgi:hypothetical protein